MSHVRVSPLHRKGARREWLGDKNRGRGATVASDTGRVTFFLFFFLAVLGLHCCVPAFSSCGERGPLLVVVYGLLIAVASLVSEHGL